MKNENIPGSIKSKSLKEVRDEIDGILSKLERNEVDLGSFNEEYKRLIQLNKYIDRLFKAKVKTISKNTKKIKKK